MNQKIRLFALVVCCTVPAQRLSPQKNVEIIANSRAGGSNDKPRARWSRVHANKLVPSSLTV
jgi:hypothetical protein